MEPPQAKPPRKRRRWLIGVVLACLVLATWVVWPSEIDPLFVGTWQVGETPCVYKLGADGTFSYMIDGEPVRSTLWRVRSGVFYNLYCHQSWAIVPAWIERFRKGTTKGDHTLKVVSVIPDALVMREPTGGVFTLNRVPDGFIPTERQNDFRYFKGTEVQPRRSQTFLIDKLEAVDAKLRAKDAKKDDGN